MDCYIYVHTVTPQFHVPRTIGASFKLNLKQLPSPIWQPIATFPINAMFELQPAHFGSKIYLVGREPIPPYTGLVYEYDPSLDTYAQVATLPVPGTRL